MFRTTLKRVWKAIAFEILAAVRFSEAVEVSTPEPTKPPTARRFLGGKTDWLVPLFESANVDIEADVLRQGFVTLMPTDMIFSDVCGLIAIFF